MSKVIVVQFTSLDGVVEDPDGGAGTALGGWAFRYPEAVAGDKFELDDVLETGVKVLGRVTWQHMARIFPDRSDAFSTRLNRMEKLVVSRSLTHAGQWSNSTLLRGDLLDEVRRRREAQDVVVAGSASVVDQLVAAGLVDQFRLLVFPVVLGKGRRLFEDLAAPLEMTLASSRPAGQGVLRQVYDRVPREVSCGTPS